MGRPLGSPDCCRENYSAAMRTSGGGALMSAVTWLSYLVKFFWNTPRARAEAALAAIIARFRIRSVSNRIPHCPAIS